MGEARRRGTREQRVAQAIERKRLEREERERRLQEWWDGLTDDQRETELRRRKRPGKEISAAILLASMLSEMEGK